MPSGGASLTWVGAACSITGPSRGQQPDLGNGREDPTPFTALEVQRAIHRAVVVTFGPIEFNPCPDLAVLARPVGMDRTDVPHHPRTPVNNDPVSDGNVIETVHLTALPRGHCPKRVGGACVKPDAASNTAAAHNPAAPHAQRTRCSHPDATRCH